MTPMPYDLQGESPIVLYCHSIMDDFDLYSLLLGESEEELKDW